jgi:crossover junction endodeoxyribonuclease RusA
VTCVCVVVDTQASLYELPIRIESVANKREHWGKKAARTKLHRFAALAIQPHPLPCVVTLIRVAPRQLDDDNLASGFKALRDGIADRLGVKDNDPRVQWKYAQVRGKAKEYAARVRIEAA